MTSEMRHDTERTTALSVSTGWIRTIHYKVHWPRPIAYDKSLRRMGYVLYSSSESQSHHGPDTMAQGDTSGSLRKMTRLAAEGVRGSRKHRDASAARTIFKYILPSTAGIVIVATTLAPSRAILLEPTVGFLSVGV
jgi:hypothetical protein